MRILHVSDCYLPRLGGIEVQVRELAVRQAAAGHDVHVATATPGHEGVFAGVEILDGVTVHRIAAHLPFELPVHPRTGHHVRAVASQQRFDVGPCACRGRVSVRLVGHARHRAARRSHARDRPQRLGRRCPSGLPVADLLARWSRWGVQPAAVSEVAAAQIRRVVGERVDVLVTPNGVDVDEWRVQPGPRVDGELRVVAVMRLAPRKRAVPLVEVLAAALEALAPGVRLTATIVGDGPDRGRVEQSLRGADLTADVVLAGRLGRDAIRAVYARSDVFVQPSVKESFGLAALEARTAGLPVVARRETGISTFVRDDVEGLLVDSDAGMAAALVRLGADRSLLERIAAHNHEVAPAESWPTVLAEVESAYDVAAATMAARRGRR